MAKKWIKVVHSPVLITVKTSRAKPQRIYDTFEESDFRGSGGRRADEEAPLTIHLQEYYYIQSHCKIRAFHNQKQ
ncbi:hypothetical protein NECAME_09115 [Necator americanus]|uniref:Uncharacterized protein n=1 Tax=Necator americanus TaxID=51031 RepID=W2TH20_NECAM|nr:hypothetical protein NECAME_09115 [Necator americanus]ETN80491.1 hypothetical protein NECAME_09115 [Necator americanus]